MTDAPLAALGEEPVVLEHKGNVLMTYAFDLVLYSVDMSTPEQKKAVLQIFDEYMSVYGSRATWTTNPKSGAWKRLRGRISGYMTPHDWLMAEPKHEGYSFLYHGGKKCEDSSDVCFMAVAGKDYNVNDKSLSKLYCRFPIKDVLEGVIDLSPLMHRWSFLLKPHHAHGGLGAGRWFDDLGEQPRISGALAELLRRYPGLQFMDITETLYNRKNQSGLYDGPRCADWLIALSDPFLEKLGGVQAVAEAMKPHPVFAYEGGAVLQAGEAPGLGSNGDPSSLPAYMHLGRVIEPVRAKNLAFVLYIPDPSSDVGFRHSPELSEKWCTRFSGKAAHPLNK
jgi:hypothetical protein